MNEKLVMTLGETAEELRVGETLVKRLVQRGEIPSIKVGRRRLVPTGELRAYIGRLTAAQAGADA